MARHKRWSSDQAWRLRRVLVLLMCLLALTAADQARAGSGAASVQLWKSAAVAAIARYQSLLAAEGAIAIQAAIIDCYAARPAAGVDVHKGRQRLLQCMALDNVAVWLDRQAALSLFGSADRAVLNAAYVHKRMLSALSVWGVAPSQRAPLARRVKRQVASAIEGYNWAVQDAGYCVHAANRIHAPGEKVALADTPC